jgi:peptidoglycan hydrolase-like protein with peptidoglycan-binding domain
MSSPTDPFRINMQYGYSPSAPTTPVHPGGGTWDDVGNWQTFLKTHGESQYVGAAYPNNNFDNNTQMATKDYQGKNGLMITGKVDQATYAKAVSQGMPPYPIVM